MTNTYFPIIFCNTPFFLLVFPDHPPISLDVKIAHSLCFKTFIVDMNRTCHLGLFYLFYYNLIWLIWYTIYTSQSDGDHVCLKHIGRIKRLLPKVTSRFSRSFISFYFNRANACHCHQSNLKGNEITALVGVVFMDSNMLCLRICSSLRKPL